MQVYELMIMFDPNLGDEVIAGIISKIENKMKGFGAEITKTDKWGIKRLASIVKKDRKITQAYYVVIYFTSETSIPAQVQSYLKVTENIIRYSIAKEVAQPPPPREVPGAPIASEAKVEAVNVGEIKGAEEMKGEDFGQS
ncbi:MAG: 30S ribosomal protein S6 [bacterium]